MKTGLLDWKRRLAHRLRAVAGIDVYVRPDLAVEVLHFGAGDGRWAVAPRFLNRAGVVYSFGIGRDLSFESHLIRSCDLKVHVFDPTPRAVEWVRTRQELTEMTFHPWGLSGADGYRVFHPPKRDCDVSYSLVGSAGGPRRGEVEVVTRSLSSIARELGHSCLTLLKMDVEGAEYEVLDDLESHYPSVKQLLVEFHHRWSSVPLDLTVNAIRRLKRAGFGLCAVSPSGREYTFLKRDLLT